jgi:putative nucleotidyltransferase with HDIG domain
MIFRHRTSATDSVREELLSEARTVRLIPSLNTVTSRLLRVMNDPDCSFAQLFDVARHDQGFSGKILGIANSALYARNCKILSLQRALHVIGLEELRGILICLTLLQDILSHWKLSQADLAEIWTHSLAVSCGARILSERFMMEDPEEVFTVAILHDIGKGVFYTRGDQYRNLVQEAGQTGRDLCALERAVFGIDHQQVGDFIAAKWRFPEELAMVVRGHHEASDDETALVRLVRLADAFIDRRDAGTQDESVVLQGEKEAVDGEVKRISELLGVTGEAREEGME